VSPAQSSLDPNQLAPRHVDVRGSQLLGVWRTEQIAADLPIRDGSARCAAVLLRLAGRRWASGPEADLPSEIPASQTELAMLCNLSRNTCSRVVKKFSGRRLMTVSYRSLTVNDPARLRDVADSG